MDNDTYDDRHSRQQKINKNIVKRLEEIEDFAQTAAVEANARFDIGIENRTIAFKQIEDLKDDLDMVKRYSLDGLRDSITDLRYELSSKLDRIDDILVVHRNQLDNKGEHKKDVPRITDKEQAIIDLGKTLWGEKPHGKEK
jgi:hypothetical protein|tara:strand:+ start:328 stop:750 length:423 start_codon:yes stop_codon:yes gene_type:complete